MYWRKVSEEARKLGVVSFKGLISEVSALQTHNYFLRKIVTWLPQGLTSSLETFKEKDKSSERLAFVFKRHLF